VISITDGQIFLDASLFNKGVRPAIDVGISVSRVGSAAQTKAMKSVSGTLKLSLAQFRELEAFVQFASDLDEQTAARIDEGRRMVELLKQGKGVPMPFEDQVVVIYAATKGFLKGAPIEKLTEVERSLTTYIQDQQSDVLAAIKKAGKIEDETKEKLEKAFETFRAAHTEWFE